MKCQGQSSRNTLYQALCITIFQHSSVVQLLAFSWRSIYPRKEGREVWGQERRVASPHPTEQPYSHGLKEASCLKHYVFTILAVWVITRSLNPLSKNPTIISATMRIQGVKITLGHLSVQNGKKPNPKPNPIYYMKKGIHGKENNSFTVLRLSLSWYSERVCRHRSSEQPTKGKKANNFSKKMKNQKQSLQPEIPFSTCTNPKKGG